jgi:hypothetical protein
MDQAAQLSFDDFRLGDRFRSCATRWATPTSPLGWIVCENSRRDPRRPGWRSDDARPVPMEANDGCGRHLRARLQGCLVLVGGRASVESGRASAAGSRRDGASGSTGQSTSSSSVRKCSHTNPGVGHPSARSAVAPHACSSVRVCKKLSRCARDSTPARRPLETTGSWFRSWRPIISSALISGVSGVTVRI